MTKAEKLRLKLAQATKTFMFSDLVTVLSQLGYEMYERAGSRVVFVNEQDGSDRIHLHKPRKDHQRRYFKSCQNPFKGKRLF